MSTKDKNKVVKSVAFSKIDKIDMKLLDFALKQGYFSTYVKRLIQRDMEHGYKVIYDSVENEKIKKLEKENDELKSVIEQLKKENTELKSKIEQIKNLLN